MTAISNQVEIFFQPAYIESWSVAKIPGFIFGALNRWQRNYGDLPRHFTLLACPRVEINALGGLPSRVIELTNPRLRIQHFTGCNKPYLIILISGEEVELQREEIQEMLPWSETYHVDLLAEMIRLQFIDANED